MKLGDIDRHPITERVGEFRNLSADLSSWTYPIRPLDQVNQAKTGIQTPLAINRAGRSSKRIRLTGFIGKSTARQSSNGRSWRRPANAGWLRSARPRR